MDSKVLGSMDKQSCCFVELDGKIWCLHDNYWNGEYFEAWECNEYGNPIKDGEEKSIRPLYKEAAKDEFELVGYEFDY